ncbi:hypothetical protein NDN08_005475 [Rhodosorus marinus]|uniref:UBX domain-containing protein n=1 Tax=Rhodosorus marinus TaxID=101924 RepID=A0AAV8V2L0_9RHOD|nr:hypothetical protein NDN08_005475 [Rhodosorus marinus]
MSESVWDVGLGQDEPKVALGLEGWEAAQSWILRVGRNVLAAGFIIAFFAYLASFLDDARLYVSDYRRRNGSFRGFATDLASRLPPMPRLGRGPRAAKPHYETTFVKHEQPAPEEVRQLRLEKLEGSGTEAGAQAGPSTYVRTAMHEKTERPNPGEVKSIRIQKLDGHSGSESPPPTAGKRFPGMKKQDNPGTEELRNLRIGRATAELSDSNATAPEPTSTASRIGGSGSSSTIRRRTNISRTIERAMDDRGSSPRDWQWHNTVLTSSQRALESDRRLREEQDREFAASLERDRELEEERQMYEQRRAEAAERLGEEPSEDEKDYVVVKVVLPDGVSKTRRFRANDPVVRLFDFVEACTGLEPGWYVFMRSTFQLSKEICLEDVLVGRTNDGDVQWMTLREMEIENYETLRVKIID